MKNNALKLTLKSGLRNVRTQLKQRLSQKTSNMLEHKKIALI